MSIEVQVEVSSEAGVDREYPWIGLSAGTIILFTGKNTGVVLADTDTGDYDDGRESSYSAGYHSDHWVEEMFHEFKGTVTLGN